jgi:anaerobic C4-dicarboxylate transporter
MMNTETRIRIAAGIALATALWAILPDWRSHVFVFRGLNCYAQNFGLARTISILMGELVLLAQLISSIGLFRIRRWAWLLAVTSISVQVLFVSIGAVRLALLPPVLSLQIEPGVIVCIISMWPSYFRTILNAIAVLLLFSKPIRSHFLNEEKK